MWGGRFSKTLDERALRYTTSLPVDRRLYEWDVLGSIAHARMLGRQNIIPPAESAALVDGLVGLVRDPPPLDGPFEDVHSLVEATLAERIGQAAGRLHTARSRNDQIATDIRLFVRSALIEGVAGILGLQTALIEAAQRSGQAVMPGYTHLQRAQPVVLGHHLLAYVEMLDRDSNRLRDTFGRADVLPLGAGALAGSPYPLDRAYVAGLLGFSSVSRNSLDAVSDRDFLAEHLAALAIVAMHLSRLAEELVVWSSAEFRFVTLDESFTTGSSIMPQKRNPDVAELLRGKTGRVYGALVSLLVMLKGLPLSYNRDLQEDKAPYFEAVDLVHDGLALSAAMVGSVTWLTDRLAEAAADPLIAATDLADHLVKRGLPFRQAHEIIGHIVRAAEENGRGLDQFSLDELRVFSPLFESSAVGLTPADIAAARDITGGTAPTQVRIQLQAARDRVDATRWWVEESAQRLPSLSSVTV
ncbi:MAG: argininosuccinate lyase [Chloroflexota bacterium]|nr:argininosuccinate lyase [Chloroflexota bacterium]